jgi:Sensors of blue-light using FAD
MLVRLMYASRATDPVRQDSLQAILKKSTGNNPGVGITGVLCFSGEIFLQVLEGGRLQVSALYNRIAQDPRHRDVVLLS